MTEVATSKSGYSHLSKGGVQDQELSFRPRNSGRCLLLSAAIALLISGSYDSIIAKLMNKQFLPPCDGCEPQYFQAPFFQTWTMYIGESLCLIAYYLDLWYAKKKGKEAALDMRTTSKSFNKPHCPVYMWAIPAFFDLCSTVMINYAFVLSQASTVQLLRNFNVVVTAIISLVYIRMALRRHQILGVVIVTLGLVLTGIYALLNPDTDSNFGDTAWLGIVMALVGTLLTAFQFVFEESLFRKYYASPFEAVGMMGVSGFIMTSLAMIVLEFIPGKGAEQTSVTFYMMGLGTKGATILIIANITFVLSIAVFNASGLIITKTGSCLLRTILISARTLTIWLIELIIGWNFFNPLNFIGLLVTFGGALFYNYNYFCAPGSNRIDLWLRNALICCKMLKDPDHLDDEITPKVLKSNSSPGDAHGVKDPAKIQDQA